MSTTAPKIKPCPNCGKIPKLSTTAEFKNFWVKCYNLDCSGNLETGYKDSEEEAIETWSTTAKVKEPEYEPYGKEWEREMLKMTKMELIDFIRRIKLKQEANTSQ